MTWRRCAIRWIVRSAACVVLGLITMDAPAEDDRLDSLAVQPADSLRLLHVREGYRVELMAAEPLVQDPVAITWGTDGRLWVAEMADYPLGLDGQGQPGGRVRWLRDSSGDGRYDQSMVFADGLSFPNGVMPWRDGVFVTAAPQILFLRDTNGDGVADEREVVFEGFQKGNQQLRVNGLRWGLDNQIYCASGANVPTRGTDTRIQETRTGDFVELGSRDLRFDPRTGQLDPQSGPTQFGRNRDDWGHWFGTMNSRPLWHYVLQDHYIRRNPNFAPPDSRKQLVLPRSPKVYPAKTPEKRYRNFQQSGHFTSACSGMVYRDELLFVRNRRQHAFTCEPFHNLVQHNVLLQAGVSFVAQRDDQERALDFFASKDRWCRPVMARTGPDGGLWIVDMYRYMIEHPQFLTDEGKAELEPHYRAGDDRGRIYRILPKGMNPRPIIRLDQLTTEQLVTQLESPNGPLRDLAQQLLITGRDADAIPLLRRMAVRSDQPLARLHALCTLDGLEALSSRVLQHALQDQHAEIRRHALRLAEQPGIEDAELRRAARRLVSDADAKVRLQLACTLGQWPGPDVASAIAKLAIRDAGDAFAEAAMLSSINHVTIDTALKIVLANRSDPAAGALAGRLLALSAAMGKHEAIVTSLLEFVQPDRRQDRNWQYGTLAGLLDALEQQDANLQDSDQQDSRLAGITSRFGDRGAEAVRRVRALTDQARSIALDSGTADSDRIVAMRLMARNATSKSSDIRALANLLDPRTSAAVQLAVVSHLSSLSEPSVADVLLREWPSHGPQVRAAVLGALLTSSTWLSTLLDAINEKRVLASDIDAGSRQTLLVTGNRSQRARTAELLAATIDTDRKRVVVEHQSVLQLAGDTTRGRVLFGKHCATCHRLDEVGNDIGPNLVSITDKRPQSLLTSILDPSTAVDAKHVMYVAETSSGKIYSGILTESANSITLTTQENKQHSILRRDIEELRSTGKSLMPEGFEKQLSHQDLADMMRYVAGPHVDP